MNRSNQDTSDRRLFARLRSGLKPKTRDRQKSPSAIPAIATTSASRASQTPPPASEVPDTPEPIVQGPETNDSREEDSFSMPNEAVPALSATSSTLPIAIPATAQPDDSRDRERTEKRYTDAVEELQKSIKLQRKNWKPFAIPTFKSFANVTDPIPQLQKDIESTLNARADSFKDPGLWSTTKRVTEKIFTAITPLAKNVLVVAKEGSNVSHFRKILLIPDSRIKPIWPVVRWVIAFN